MTQLVCKQRVVQTGHCFTQHFLRVVNLDDVVALTVDESYFVTTMVDPRQRLPAFREIVEVDRVVLASFLVVRDNDGKIVVRPTNNSLVRKELDGQPEHTVT